MSIFTIKVLNALDNIKFVDSAEGFASLVVTQPYESGDSIQVETTQKNIHVRLQLDDALGSEIVYLTDTIRYQIPFAEKKTNITPKAFSGDLHYIYIREIDEDEIHQYRNQAKNICDQHNVQNLYPHAFANVETRGEAKFFACNAIDGVCENRSHGIWPYQSWGINRQDDAELTVDFGRTIETDKVVIFIRADFPHDNWWTQVTLSFSDGTTINWPIEKNRFAQVLRFDKRQITWIKIGNLLKADDPSPFPALTQLEVYGKVV